LHNLDPTSDQILITFDILGNFLRQIGLYSIIYNSQYFINLTPNGDFQEKPYLIRENIPHFYKFNSRKDLEIEFQINLWKLLKGNHSFYIEPDVLIELIMLLSDRRYNYYCKENEQELINYVSDLIKAADFNSENSENLEKSQPCWDSEKLVKTFKKLYSGKLILKADFKKNCEFRDYSFTPKINKKSREIANKSMSIYLQRNNSERSIEIPNKRSLSVCKSMERIDSHVNLMLEKYKELSIKKEKMREIKQFEEIQKCTFRPILLNNSKILTSKSKRREMCDSTLKKYEKSKEERELENCTFHPKLYQNNTKIFKNENMPFKPIGYEKIITRLRNANYENEQKIKEKTRIPIGENYEKVKKLKENIPKMVNRQKILKEPILKVEIDVSNNRKSTIVLRKGDNLEEIIRNFAKTFQLNDQKIEKLYDSLSQLTQGLL